MVTNTELSIPNNGYNCGTDFHLQYAILKRIMVPICMYKTRVKTKTCIVLLHRDVTLPFMVYM